MPFYKQLKSRPNLLFQNAIGALLWTDYEMERRYKILKEAGQRNIENYHKAQNNNEIPHSQNLPYIVLIFDDLSDVMFQESELIEKLLVSLGQKARIVGIHLVLVAQRPASPILTQSLKSNIPSRIAFKLSNETESLAILNKIGAEKLVGQGDTFYLSPFNTITAPVRVQTPYVDDDEVKAISDFWHNQSEAATTLPVYQFETLLDLWNKFAGGSQRISKERTISTQLKKEKLVIVSQAVATEDSEEIATTGTGSITAVTPKHAIELIESAGKIKNLQAQVIALEKEIVNLRAENESLKTKIRDLEHIQEKTDILETSEDSSPSYLLINRLESVLQNLDNSARNIVITLLANEGSLVERTQLAQIANVDEARLTQYIPQDLVSLGLITVDNFNNYTLKLQKLEQKILDAFDENWLKERILRALGLS